MKNLKFFLLLLFGLNFQTTLFSQGFTPPSDSNAVVYFVRLTGYGGMSSFEYFHNNQFIGIFKGKNYMRYECPAGKNLLWASSEYKDFLNCDLKAGKTYIVVVNVVTGTLKPRVELEPISEENRNFKRAKKMIHKKEPIVTPLSLLSLTQEKLEGRGFIENILERYEKEWKNSSYTKVISPEDFIPIEKLKKTP
jgi:hypothetical protein